MARLSEAAAAGTVAVFKCFAAQAHATLVGLMHIRSTPPLPRPSSSAAAVVVAEGEETLRTHPPAGAPDCHETHSPHRLLLRLYSSHA